MNTTPSHLKRKKRLVKCKRYYSTLQSTNYFSHFHFPRNETCRMFFHARLIWDLLNDSIHVSMDGLIQRRRLHLKSLLWKNQIVYRDKAQRLKRLTGAFLYQYNPLLRLYWRIMYPNLKDLPLFFLESFSLGLILWLISYWKRLFTNYCFFALYWIALQKCNVQGILQEVLVYI